MCSGPGQELYPLQFKGAAEHADSTEGVNSELRSSGLQGKG